MKTETFGRVKVEILDKVQDIVSRSAVTLFDQLRSNKASVIGVATGSTFIPFYEYVGNHYKEAGVSFRDAVTFNLDEYYPMDRNSSDSYYYYMQKYMYSRVDINAAHANIPDGSAPNPLEESIRYEDSIRRAGGIDLQFLGIGTNGHIGFNEPGTDFRSRTHVVALAESTRLANSRFIKEHDSVPASAITMGIGTILDARKIVLVAYGRTKAQAIRDALNNEISTALPASALRNHDNVTFMIDDDAASLL